MKSLKLIVIAVLIAFNLLLLYINGENQKQIKLLHLQLSSSASRVGQAGGNEMIKLIHPDIELPDAGLQLVVFFKEQSCSSCLAYEVPNLNAFYQMFGSFTKAYLIGADESNLKAYGPVFPYHMLTPGEPILNNILKFDNPIALLVDSNGLVHKLYQAEVGNRAKSHRFYQHMFSLFQSLQ